MPIKCCTNKKVAGNLKKTVNFLNIIAEKNRLKILCLLQSGDKCVCNIWQYLGLSQNLTSHHLKVLKDFGLITSRKEGLWVYYSINKKNIKKFNLSLSKFLQSYGKQQS